MNGKTANSRLFISYLPGKAEWVRSFARDVAEQGFDVWSEDRIKVEPGSTEVAAFDRALRESDAVIFVLSPRSLDRPNIWFELGVAMGGGKVVVPIVAEDLDVSRRPAPLQGVLSIDKGSPWRTAAIVASGLAEAS